MEDVLVRSELFGRLSRERLRKLIDRSRAFSYAAGETIFKEGDEAAEVYILTAGRVTLEMEIRPVPERPPIPTAVEVITEDECFGWSALVDPYVYTASARCLTPCTALALKGDLLRQAMKDDPGLGLEVMTRLVQLVSRRLANTRMRLTTGLGLILQGEGPRLSEVSDRHST